MASIKIVFVWGAKIWGCIGWGFTGYYQLNDQLI
jgi:hypothetical protein